MAQIPNEPEELNYEFEANMFDHGRLTVPKNVRKKLDFGKGTRLLIKIVRILERNPAPKKPSKTKRKKSMPEESQKVDIYE